MTLYGKAYIIDLYGIAYNPYNSRPTGGQIMHKSFTDKLIAVGVWTWIILGVAIAASTVLAFIYWIIFVEVAHYA